MTSSQDSSTPCGPAEVKRTASGREGTSSRCSSANKSEHWREVPTSWDIVSTSLCSDLCAVMGRRWGDAVLGKDFACRRREFGVEGRIASVVTELLFPSGVSSSSGTSVSSVLTIENGIDRIVCAVSSGVVTACGVSKSYASYFHDATGSSWTSDSSMAVPWLRSGSLGNPC